MVNELLEFRRVNVGKFLSKLVKIGKIGKNL
jgi:hypothetical protein